MVDMTDSNFTAEVDDVPKAVPENKDPPTIEHVEASCDETTNDSHTTATVPVDSNASVHDKSESVKWVIDNNFRKELIRLGISEDPVEWLEWK